MICGYCNKEIGYDNATVSYHLDEKCMEESRVTAYRIVSSPSSLAVYVTMNGEETLVKVLTDASTRCVTK